MAQLRQSEEAARQAMENNSPDFLNNLCHIADHRLYKIVKWCKSLPLFRHITVSSQYMEVDEMDMFCIKTEWTCSVIRQNGHILY